ncbi:MAG: ATP-grasp fold amidoligase family protein [Rhodocyclaceae bacterium]
MKSNIRQRLVAGLQKAIAAAFVPIKWVSDVKRTPLTREHYDLYKQIHRRCLQKLGRFPDLVRCPGYNDKIQWLKLFDQSEEVVLCSDKLSLRDFVERRLGPGYTPKVYQVGNTFSEIDFSALPQSFVIKTNHDSGSVILVPDKAKLDMERAKTRIERSLARRYGWKKGEWAYRWITPKVFVEEYLSPGSVSAPADYKFHCVNGQVKWLQYIFDRGRDVKETITDPAGNCLGISFDHKMRSVTGFERPAQWEQLKRVAEKLSGGLSYVRVDLYLIGDSIFVGEMTFYPKNGCYLGDGQRVLGKLLDFDRSTAKPFLCGRLALQAKEAAGHH